VEAELEHLESPPPTPPARQPPGPLIHSVR
jgi:hypothetical protein